MSLEDEGYIHHHLQKGRNTSIPGNRKIEINLKE